MEFRLLSDIFTKVLNMSVTAGIIICAVFFFRLFLRKAPKIFSYLLWGIVLFRLLCPVSVSAPFSVLRICNAPTAETGSPEFISMRPLEHTPGKNPENDSFISKNFLSQSETSVPQSGASSCHSVQTAALKYGSLFWIAGILAMTGYGVVSALCLKRRLAVSIRIKDNVYLSDYIGAPFATGVILPKIYLPHGLSEQETQFILLHEQTHIQRKDPAIKLLAFFALTIHWFNPLVWAAFSAAERDMEMSCDETVMKKIKKDIRTEYSNSLLCLSSGKQPFWGTPLSFGKSSAKSRVSNVMKYKKPALFTVGAASALVIACLLILCTNPKVKNGSKDSAGEPAPDAAPLSTERSLTADPPEETDKDTLAKERAPVYSYSPKNDILMGQYGEGFWEGFSDQYTEETVCSVTADVTHDGILDRLDVIAADYNESPHSDAVERLSGVGLGYVKIYPGIKDGGFEENPLFVTPQLSGSHATNGQVCLVKKDGMDYILTSNLYEIQGRAEYCYTVFYLDSDRRMAVCADEQLVNFPVNEADDPDSPTQKECVPDFFTEHLKDWTNDSILFISCDVFSEPSVYISTEDTMYTASDYYDSVLKQR